MNSYMVYFTRKHEAGLLSGKTTAGTLPFATWHSANEWIERTSNRLLENEYRIESAWIEGMPTRK